MSGVNGLHMVRTNSFEEAIVLATAARRGDDIRRAEREELAEMITEKIVTAWNKGQKG